MNRTIPDIAVIGAGPAGLACAVRLAEHGLQIQVYDEGHPPGGRAAPKKLAGLTFEHGAPHQQPLIESLARRVPILQKARVAAMQRLDDTWCLRIAGMPLQALHARAVLAVPAPRAVALRPGLEPLLRGVRIRPVLTALLGLPEPLTRLRDSIRFESGSLLEARRQPSGGPGRPEAWVLHASPAFSLDNLECEPDGIARHLWQCFRQALSLDIAEPGFVRGFRWRHALTDHPLGRSCWYDERLGLGVCGDWCLGDNTAAAVTSGLALADRILGIAERPTRIMFRVERGSGK